MSLFASSSVTYFHFLHKGNESAVKTRDRYPGNNNFALFEVLPIAAMKAAVAESTDGRPNVEGVPLDGALSSNRSDPPAGKASPCGNLSRLTLLIALLMICLTTALPFGYLFAWSRTLWGASVPEGPGQRPEPPPRAIMLTAAAGRGVAARSTLGNPGCRVRRRCSRRRRTG